VGRNTDIRKLQCFLKLRFILHVFISLSLLKCDNYFLIPGLTAGSQTPFYHLLFSS